MRKLNEIYKCNVCGNIVEVVHAEKGQLVCCGEPMELLQAKSEDEGREKHVPVIGSDRDNISVEVGSVLHPMEDNHYIEWIEVIADGYVDRKMLKPGDEPKAVFCINGDKQTARAYCNIHGLWEHCD